MSKDESELQCLSRRAFIGSVGAVIATGVACGSSSDDGSAASGGAASGSGGTAAGSGGSATGTGGSGSNGGAGGSDTEYPVVALVRGSDWADAVESAIAMVGGLPELTGQIVLLRPNVISSDPSPTTTNPEVIRGVIRAVKKKGATTVYVADDGWATNDTVASMNSLGIGTVCTEEGATPLDLKGGSTTTISHPNALAWPNGMEFYDAVLEANYVVNIPVCKSHGMANFTMALKAWYGHVPQGERNHVSLAEQIAELHLAKQENFVVLDATKAMVTGGPQSGETAEPGLVVASRDAIAADVTGLCIHKQFGTRSGSVYNLGVWEQAQIVRAMELGFPGWLSGPGGFTYASEGVDEHAEIMAWREA